MSQYTSKIALSSEGKTLCSRTRRWQRAIARIVPGIGLVYLLLLIPEAHPPVLADPHGAPFYWASDQRWLDAGGRFGRSKAVRNEIDESVIREKFHRGYALLDRVSSQSIQPDDAILDTMESVMFGLGSVIVRHEGMTPDYARFVSRACAVVKRQSRGWDLNSRRTKERMYRLFSGGNALLEELIMQSPAGPWLHLPEAYDEPSATPSAGLLGMTIHSGDIIISRGRTAVSAFIARASDFPGLYSHAALAYVDPSDHHITIIESDGNEHGVMLTTADDYVKDTKSRIMVLRLRPDLPELHSDPLLPHKAATYMLDEARSRDIPFDFAMDGSDHSKMYCSEVPAAAYEKFGINLMMNGSGISDPGVSAWFAALGIGSSSMQGPSDFEYDRLLCVIAQWRDTDALFPDHVHNAVTDVMVAGAAQGDRLEYSFTMLPYARIAKLVSMAMYACGGTGMIPEGMGPGSALCARTYINTHAALTDRVLMMAAEFEKREGYGPSVWELSRLAQEAKAELH